MYCRGVTLIELLAAMAISAIVIGLVFYSWQSFERYTVKNNQRSEFLSEVDRIAQNVTASVTRSPQVYVWDDHSIICAGAREADADTLHFAVIDSMLCCNGRPLSTTASSLRVFGFDIAEPPDRISQSSGTLLQITISARDGFGNATSLTRKAYVQKITQNTDGREWN